MPSRMETETEIETETGKEEKKFKSAIGSREAYEDKYKYKAAYKIECSFKQRLLLPLDAYIGPGGELRQRLAGEVGVLACPPLVRVELRE